MPDPARRLVCDWGTTHLRAWTLDAAGEVIARLDLPRGVGGLAPGEAERVFHAEVQIPLGAAGLPALLCGMVGSTLGWRTVPYLACPAGAEDLAAGMAEAAPGVRIVPGLRGEGPLGAPDVMRGEETQILGWLAMDPARGLGDHVLCLPGTHAKWVQVSQGRIVRFVTAMTGELFALLMTHSVLRAGVQPDDRAAFAAGLAAAGDGDALAARLFTARSRVVAGGAPADSTAAFVSGLLIGAEVAAVPALLGASAPKVTLLGEARLCGLYAQALTHHQISAEICDGEAAVLAGLAQLGDIR